MAARAVVLMLAQRGEAAREAAREATELAERLHYPIGRAAALEARGVCAADARRELGAPARGRAGAGPSSTGHSRRRAARLLAGQALVQADPEAGRLLLGEAADEIERLGVRHLSERARALAAG